jgi:hypothetical protein
MPITKSFSNLYKSLKNWEKCVSIVSRCYKHLKCNFEEEILSKLWVKYIVRKLFPNIIRKWDYMSNLVAFDKSYFCLKFQDTMCFEINNVPWGQIFFLLLECHSHGNLQLYYKLDGGISSKFEQWWVLTWICGAIYFVSQLWLKIY